MRFADFVFIAFLVVAVALCGCAPQRSESVATMQTLLGYMHQTCSHGELVVHEGDPRMRYSWTCALGKIDDTLYPQESEEPCARGDGTGWVECGRELRYYRVDRRATATQNCTLPKGAEVLVCYAP